MEELPLQNKLVLRNPEVYKKDWKCMLCDQEQESWSHLWRCSHLLPRLTALQQATKKGFEDLHRSNDDISGDGISVKYQSNIKPDMSPVDHFKNHTHIDTRYGNDFLPTMN